MKIWQDGLVFMIGQDTSLHLPPTWKIMRSGEDPVHSFAHNLLYEHFIYRTRLYTFIQELKDNIEREPYVAGEQVSQKEFRYTVLIVVAAILNPCKHPYNFYISHAEYKTVKTKWDVTRYADCVKLSRVTLDGARSQADLNLTNYFELAQIGDIDVPATILDCHGRIMVWYLPSILSKHRIVCGHLFTEASPINMIYSKTITMLSLVWRIYWPNP